MIATVVPAFVAPSVVVPLAQVQTWSFVATNSFLHNVALALRDVADHGIHYLVGRNGGAWLKNHVPHGHLTVARDDRRPFTKDALDAFRKRFSPVSGLAH
jgi:hypothetical protein